MQKLLLSSILVLGVSAIYSYADTENTTMEKTKTSLSKTEQKVTNKKSKKIQKSEQSKTKMSKCGAAHNKSKSGKC